jgi:excisionase family DNA binding protein
MKTSTEQLAEALARVIEEHIQRLPVGNSQPNDTVTDDAEIILQELRAETQKALSPWADRKGAAAYCACSTHTIDIAANKGEIKRYFVGDSPRFKKKDLDEWIEENTRNRRRTLGAM